MESFHMLETVKQWNAQTNEDVRLTICKAVSDHGEKNMNKLRNHQGNRQDAAKKAFATYLKLADIVNANIPKMLDETGYSSLEE